MVLHSRPAEEPTFHGRWRVVRCKSMCPLHTKIHYIALHCSRIAFCVVRPSFATSLSYHSCVFCFLPTEDISSYIIRSYFLFLSQQEFVKRKHRAFRFLLEMSVALRQPAKPTGPSEDAAAAAKHANAKNTAFTRITNTAMVLYHRFFVYQSMAGFNWLYVFSAYVCTRMLSFSRKKRREEKKLLSSFCRSLFPRSFLHTMLMDNWLRYFKAYGVVLLVCGL